MGEQLNRLWYGIHTLPSQNCGIYYLYVAFVNTYDMGYLSIRPGGDKIEDLHSRVKSLLKTEGCVLHSHASLSYNKRSGMYNFEAVRFSERKKTVRRSFDSAAAVANFFL